MEALTHYQPAYTENSFGSTWKRSFFTSFDIDIKQAELCKVEMNGGIERRL